MKMIRQTMFRTGEVDVTTWKRTDVEEYITAAQSLQNCEISTTGLFRKRKGTKNFLDATACCIANSKMFEFVDNDDNYYLVIAKDNEFCIYNAPTFEGNVVDHNGNQVITAHGDDVVAEINGFIIQQHVTTPYQSFELSEIDYAQDGDTLFLTHPNHPPARLYVSSYTPLTFSYQVLDIYPLPAYDFGSINYNTYTVSLSAPGATLTLVITNPSGGATGFDTSWIGGEIIGGGATDIDPVGYAIITNVTNSGNTTTFTATVQIPFKTSGFSTQGSQYSIRKPAWGSTGDFPAKVLFYQNRLWLANTKSLPETVFGSKINSPINFDVGTGKDTDAIVYTLGVSNSGSITWLNGGKQLEIFTRNIEFACPQDTNTALTPSTFSVNNKVLMVHPPGLNQSLI